MEHLRRYGVDDESCLACSLAAQVPHQQDVTIDAAQRQEVIEKSIRALTDGYIFAETAEKMSSALRDRSRRGEYDGITSAKAPAEKVTKDLRAISKDLHLSLRYSDTEIPASRSERTPSEVAEIRREILSNNCGFEKVERLAGNVSLIILRGFSPAGICGDIVVAAMNSVSNADASPRRTRSCNSLK